MLLLAFAYFAESQAAVSRNTTQTAADAAALAVARESRDLLRDDVLAALTSGDEEAAKAVIQGSGKGVGDSCSEAYPYAADNGARVLGCGLDANSVWGFTVEVESLSSVGKSVVKGSDAVYATAHATAVVEPRCLVEGIEGVLVKLTCDNVDITVDPTAPGYTLDLSDFYTVHLSK